MDKNKNKQLSATDNEKENSEGGKNYYSVKINALKNYLDALIKGGKVNDKIGIENISDKIEEFESNKKRLLLNIFRIQKWLIDKEKFKEFYNNKDKIIDFFKTLRSCQCTQQDITEVLQELNQQQEIDIPKYSQQQTNTLKQQNTAFGNINDYLNYFCVQIKSKIEEFGPKDLQNILNQLANIYITQDDLEKTSKENTEPQYDLFKTICEQINNQVDNFELNDLARTFNDLSKVFLSNSRLSEDAKQPVLGCLNNIVNNDKIKEDIKSINKKINEIIEKDIKPIINPKIDKIGEIVTEIKKLVDNEKDLSNKNLKKFYESNISSLETLIKELKDEPVDLGIIKKIEESGKYIFSLKKQIFKLKNLQFNKEEIILSNDRIKTLKQKLEDLSKIIHETKYTLKRNLFFLKNVLEIPIEDLSSLKEILKEKIPLNEQHKATSLENDIRGFLKNNKDVTKDSIKEEKSIEYRDNNFDYSHPIDFIFEYKGKTIYCEADGPTHFLNSDQIEDNKTPQTKIRDKINKFIVSKMNKKKLTISKINREKQLEEKDYVYYITVPASKCKNKEMFFDYLDGELELEIAKTSSLLQKESEKIIRILEGNNPNKTNSLPSLNSHVDTGQNTPEYPIGETIKKAMEEITNDKRLKRTQSHPIKLS